MLQSYSHIKKAKKTYTRHSNEIQKDVSTKKFYQTSLVQTHQTTTSHIRLDIKNLSRLTLF